MLFSPGEADDFQDTQNEGVPDTVAIIDEISTEDLLEQVDEEEESAEV